MLIDTLMPDPHFTETHTRRVKAPPARVEEAVRGVTGREVRLLAPLMAVRSLPGRLRGRARAFDWARPVLEGALRSGFVVVAEEPGREIVLGAVGRFWRPVGNMPVTVGSGRELQAFDQPGFAKALVNFHVEPEGEGTRLTTRTLIRGTDRAARWKFGLYWALIRAGSGLIRRSWLAGIARRAERA